MALFLEPSEEDFLGAVERAARVSRQLVAEVLARSERPLGRALLHAQQRSKPAVVVRELMRDAPCVSAAWILDGLAASSALQQRLAEPALTHPQPPHPVRADIRADFYYSFFSALTPYLYQVYNTTDF